MNEKDLEQRLRSVVDDPRPSAPPSLRTFLRELPETAPSPRSRPLAWLRGMAGGLRGLVSPAPATRRAQLGFAVSMALVVGLVGGALLMSVRQNPVPASTPSPTSETSTAKSTPRRSIANAPSPYLFVLGTIPGFQWAGILSTEDDNNKQALPVSAVQMKGGGYVGVSSDDYGQNGLVFSQDGIYWDWDPPTEVDPSGVVLTAIATDGKGRLVAVGAAQGLDGTRDGRIYTSEDGHKWTAVPNATTLFGGTAIRTIVHGLSGYVALGWNDNDPVNRTVREWLSTDGIHWSVMGGVPIVGTWGFVIPTDHGYVLSGRAQEASMNQPPIWTSADGHNWHRTGSADNNGLRIGPIVSASVKSTGEVIALARSTDESGTELVKSNFDQTMWSLIKTDSGTQQFMAVASIKGPPASSVNCCVSSHLLVATGMAEGGHLYISTDDGTTWSIASNVSKLPGAPLGQTILQLGVNYGGESARVLSYGKPEYGMGIWLGYAVGL